MSSLVSAAADALHAELRTLIAGSRQRLAGAVNAELTRLYWAVGQRLAAEALGGERAQYGSQQLEQLGQQLSKEFGRGLEARNLRRMVKFAQAYPSAEIVSTLSTKLSWGHLVRNLYVAGNACGDMPVLCADTRTRDLCACTLAQPELPVENRLGSGDFDPTSNKIKVMTMKVSKGLDFPVVALPGVGHMPAAGEDEKEAARVFYVAATRATQSR
jgi:hypothetical protein